MIAPITGHKYLNPSTGVVVQAVDRRPSETNLKYFAGEVLYPGRCGGWQLLGRRFYPLSVRTFQEVRETGVAV